MKSRTDQTAAMKPDLAQKAVQFVANAMDKRLHAENFVLSDKTPYDEIFRERIMSVRYYPPLPQETIRIEDTVIEVERTKRRVPLVLVPPLAATAIIFDLLPQRSVASFFLARGFEVYLINWGDVTASDHDVSLETYVLDWMPAALARIRQHSSEAELSIFAYCMGGLLSLMYAAVTQDKNIRNIITVASPVDMHQSGMAGRLLTAIHGPARRLSTLLNVSLLDMPARYLHVPGWLSSLAFKLTDPVGNVVSRVNLLINMWDIDYVKEHHTMSRWFNEMADYPGETIKDMAVHMMLNNRMSKGVMRIGDREARFKKIKCSILAFAGDKDTIVSVEAARKVLEIVSSKDKQFCIVPGGHAGVFGGSKAPANAWTISADWLAERSD